MINKLIGENDVLTRDILKEFVGKYVHARTNLHEVVNPDTGNKEKVNIWFAGRVAGFEEANISYDYNNDTFLDAPRIVFHILLTDGTGYVLSEEKLVVDEITEDEFIDMVAKHQAEQYVKESILLPGKDF